AQRLPLLQCVMYVSLVTTTVTYEDVSSTQQQQVAHLLSHTSVMAVLTCLNTQKCAGLFNRTQKNGSVADYNVSVCVCVCVCVSVSELAGDWGIWWTGERTDG